MIEKRRSLVWHFRHNGNRRPALWSGYGFETGQRVETISILSGRDFCLLVSNVQVRVKVYVSSVREKGIAIPCRISYKGSWDSEGGITVAGGKAV